MHENPITYNLEWTEDFRGQRGWVARFEDGSYAFVNGAITDDPEMLDRFLRDAHEDIQLGDEAPEFRVYKVGE